MIIDITEIVLTPGNGERDCLGNGAQDDIECCCDECEYMLCCLEGSDPDQCMQCQDRECPHSPNCRT